MYLLKLVFFFFRIYAQKWDWQTMGNSIFILFYFFKKLPYCFPQWLHQFTFPQKVYKGSLFSTSLPVFFICVLSHSRHSDRYEVMSHCGSIYICLMVSHVEHLLLVTWMSALENCLFSSSAHSLIGLVGCLMLSSVSCLYIWDINPLTVISFKNIFSHSVGCLFIFIQGFLCRAEAFKFH